jgi:hypothetical protein
MMDSGSLSTLEEIVNIYVLETWSELRLYTNSDPIEIEVNIISIMLCQIF